MPFDGLSISTLPPVSAPMVGNTLASLGLVPVARGVAEQHKKKMIREYVVKSATHAITYQLGEVRWRCYDFDGCANLSANIRLIERAFGAMPLPITEVIHAVSNGIQNAKFSLEYFDADPVINVSYTDTSGHRHFDCLGIWDGSEVVAVATSNCPD